MLKTPSNVRIEADTVAVRWRRLTEIYLTSRWAGQRTNLLHQCVLVPNHMQLAGFASGDTGDADALHADLSSSRGDLRERPLVRACEGPTVRHPVALGQQIIRGEAVVRERRRIRTQKLPCPIVPMQHAIRSVDGDFRIEKLANKRRILLVPMIFDHTADDGLVLFGHSQPPYLWWNEEISGGNNGGQEVL